MLKLTSGANERIKKALALWKRRDREARDLFLIEGFRELTRARGARVKIETLFICPTLFLGINERALVADIENEAEVFECSETVFRKLSYRDRPDGLIAVAKQTHLGLDALCGDFFVVAEGIEKPGNLGTILRSADAVKADGVIVCDRKTDIHNPNVVRASVGTLFTQPVVEASQEETFQFLKEKNILLVAATPSGALDFHAAPLDKSLAILVGTEQYGLSSFWMERADFKIKIPMLGVADSLNVAMATTLLLYEVHRQRALLR